jgi:hypothetical protein
MHLFIGTKSKRDHGFILSFVGSYQQSPEERRDDYLVQPVAVGGFQDQMDDL